MDYAKTTIKTKVMTQPDQFVRFMYKIASFDQLARKLLLPLVMLNNIQVVNFSQSCGFFGFGAISLLIGLVASMALESSAHGDTDLLIAEITKEIEAHPREVEHLIQRARVYTEAGHLPEALTDCRLAEDMAPQQDFVHAEKGRVLLRMKRYESSANAYAEAVRLSPEKASWRIQYGWSLRQLKQTKRALDQYQIAVFLCPAGETTPIDCFVEAANVVMDTAPGQSSHASIGLAIVEEGIAQYGPIQLLTLKALEIERHTGNDKAALQRLDQLLARETRKDRWLEMKADLLLAQGRLNDARATYVIALDSIARLPQRVQRVPATEDRIRNCRAALSQLNSQM